MTILGIPIYYSFHAAAFIALFAMNIYRSEYYHITKLKSVDATIFIYALSYLWMLILFWIESGFKLWGGQNFVRIFIWIPLIAFPVSKIVKVDWLKLCDFIAPCLCLNQGIGHFGCLFPGCCHGYPCDWGIYSKEAGTKCFPIQIIEAVTALIITYILLKYSQKRHYPTDGRTYAIMLILFGSTRFIWEFFRDNTKLFLGISNLAIHALVMCIAGLVAYFFIIPKLEKKKHIHKN